MSKKQSCKELSSLEKLYILLQPYIRRREIKEVSMMPFSESFMTCDCISSLSSLLSMLRIKRSNVQYDGSGFIMSNPQ